MNPQEDIVAVSHLNCYFSVSKVTSYSELSLKASRDLHCLSLLVLDFQVAVGPSTVSLQNSNNVNSCIAYFFTTIV